MRRAASIPPRTPTACRPSRRPIRRRARPEGAFYLWRADEVDALLGADAAVVKPRFGIEPQGNAPQDPQQEFTGKNLLYVAQSVDDLAQRTGRPEDEIADAC